MAVYKCMKYLLFAFNFLMLLIGGVAIGLGVWALVSDYGADEMKSLTGSDLYEAGCITVIVGGSVVFLISFLGCCGAWMENRCMLGIYFVIMLLFLILFVVAAVVSFFFRDDLEDELAKEMTKTLKNDYGLVGNNDITDVWDKIQVELSCCGVRGNRNSESSWFLWQESMWYNVSNTGTNPNALKALPSSCCVKGTSFPDCQNFKTTNQAPMMDAAMVTTDNLSLNEEGCIDKLKDKIDEYIIAIAVIAVVVLIVMFCCVLFSVYVCMHVSRKDMVV